MYPFRSKYFLSVLLLQKTQNVIFLALLHLFFFLLIFYLYPIVVYSIVDLCVQEEPLPRHGVDAGLPGDRAAQQGRVPQDQEEAGGRHQRAGDCPGPRQQGQQRGTEVHQALPGTGA